MNKNRFIPYGRHSINATDAEACLKVLQSDIISRGPVVDEFEKAISGYCGAKYGVAFNSGTSALQATYFAAGVNRFDRIFTTPNTFIATISGAINVGTSPIFIDIDRTTGNLDLNQLEGNLNHPSSRGRDVIVPVHFAGIPVNMEALDSMISKPDTIVIEDAAHALGSYYSNGQKVGSCFWSDMTVFSFHPNKNITTGEGGMVLTNDEEMYNKLKLFRNNGIERMSSNPWFYEVQNVSGNYNLTDFQSALGLSQLERLEGMVNKRRLLTARYRKNLQDKPYFLLMDSIYDKFAAYHLFVVQINFAKYGVHRQHVMEQLLNLGIGTQIHYIPLYRQPFIKNESNSIEEYFPQMETYYTQTLSLPLHCEMNESDVDMISETLIKILKG